ncbi:MAG: adenylate cyclase, partial [Actinomycetota bacterium]|nr:adenylate cyclase [Actinomycetota bacterium]
AAVDRLYRELNTVLTEHRGTLNNYVGDAYFAIWECDTDPDAANNALRFALTAARTVAAVAPTLALRHPDGRPIHMGWGVVMGRAAMSSLSHALVTVLGDSTNLAFRLSGLAGREGHADVVVTAAIRDRAGPEFTFDPGVEVSVRGRTGIEKVFGAHAV